MSRTPVRNALPALASSIFGPPCACALTCAAGAGKTFPHPQRASERERVALSVDASVTPPFIRQHWRGNLAISGRLQLDPQRNAVYLADASVDRVSIEGMDESQQRQFAKVASLVADQLMHETPIYTFKPDELRYAGVQFVPTQIKTTSTGLVVTVEPVK